MAFNDDMEALRLDLEVIRCEVRDAMDKALSMIEALDGYADQIRREHAGKEE